MAQLCLKSDEDDLVGDLILETSDSSLVGISSYDDDDFLEDEKILITHLNKLTLYKLEDMMALKSWYLDGSARCFAVAVRQQHQGRKFYYITRDGQELKRIKESSSVIKRRIKTTKLMNAHCCLEFKNHVIIVYNDLSVQVLAEQLVTSSPSSSAAASQVTIVNVQIVELNSSSYLSVSFHDNQSSNIQTNIYRLDVQGEQLLIHPYNNNINNNNNRSCGGDDDLDDEDANDLADSLKSMKLTTEKVFKFLILDQNQIVVYGQIEGGNRGIYLMDGRCGQKRNMYIYKEQCQGKIIQLHRSKKSLFIVTTSGLYEGKISYQPHSLSTSIIHLHCSKQRMKVMSGSRLEEDKGDGDRLDFFKEFIDGKKTADLKKFSSLLYDHHMEAPTIMDLMTRLLSDDNLQTPHFKQRLRSVVHHLQLPNDFTQYLSTMNLHHVLKLLKFLHDELVSNEEEDDEDDDHLHPHHHSTIETIVDWLNMLLDCHYPRLVLHLAGSREVKSSKFNNSADDVSGGEGASLLNDILTYIDVTVSEAKEGLCQKIINQAKYLKVKQKKSSRKRYYVEAFQFS